MSRRRLLGFRAEAVHRGANKTVLRIIMLKIPRPKNATNKLLNDCNRCLQQNKIGRMFFDVGSRKAKNKNKNEGRKIIRGERQTPPNYAVLRNLV